MLTGAYIPTRYAPNLGLQVHHEREAVHPGAGRQRHRQGQGALGLGLICHADHSDESYVISHTEWSVVVVVGGDGVVDGRGDGGVVGSEE